VPESGVLVKTPRKIGQRVGGGYRDQREFNRQEDCERRISVVQRSGPTPAANERTSKDTEDAKYDLHRVVKQGDHSGRSARGGLPDCEN